MNGTVIDAGSERIKISGGFLWTNVLGPLSGSEP